MFTDIPNDALATHAKACLASIRDHAVAMTTPGTPVERIQDHLSAIQSALGGVVLVEDFEEEEDFEETVADSLVQACREFGFEGATVTFHDEGEVAVVTGPVTFATPTWRWWETTLPMLQALRVSKAA